MSRTCWTAMHVAPTCDSCVAIAAVMSMEGLGRLVTVQACQTGLRDEGSALTLSSAQVGFLPALRQNR